MSRFADRHDLYKLNGRSKSQSKKGINVSFYRLKAASKTVRFFSLITFDTQRISLAFILTSDVKYHCFCFGNIHMGVNEPELKVRAFTLPKSH